MCIRGSRVFALKAALGIPIAVSIQEGRVLLEPGWAQSNGGRKGEVKATPFFEVVNSF